MENDACINVVEPPLPERRLQPPLCPQAGIYATLRASIAYDIETSICRVRLARWQSTSFCCYKPTSSTIDRLPDHRIYPAPTGSTCTRRRRRRFDYGKHASARRRRRFIDHVYSAYILRPSSTSCTKRIDELEIASTFPSKVVRQGHCQHVRSLPFSGASKPLRLCNDANNKMCGFSNKVLPALLSSSSGTGTSSSAATALGRHHPGPRTLGVHHKRSSKLGCSATSQRQGSSSGAASSAGSGRDLRFTAHQKRSHHSPCSAIPGPFQRSIYWRHLQQLL